MKEINFESERLFLRLIDAKDLDAIHELHSLPETDRFNTLGIPKDKEETKKIVSGWQMFGDDNVLQNVTFVIEKKSSKNFIGLIALKVNIPKYKKAEVWYKLHKNYWNQGYGTEALKMHNTFWF